MTFVLIVLPIQESFHFSTGGNGTKMCGSSVFPYTDLIRWTLYGDIDGISNNEGKKSPLGDCNCLPACTSVSYETLVDRAKFDSRAIEMDYDEENSSK